MKIAVLLSGELMLRKFDPNLPVVNFLYCSSDAYRKSLLIESLKDEFPSNFGHYFCHNIKINR